MWILVSFATNNNFGMNRSVMEQFFKCYKVGTEIKISVKSLNIAINKNQPTHICLPHHKWWHSLCRSFRNARCKKSSHIKSACRKKHEVVNPTNDIFMVRNHHSYFTFIFYIKAHAHIKREWVRDIKCCIDFEILYKK